jgi:predicted RNase H-like HicB family nuclease
LPGLVTEGNTLEEARKMAEDAIQCYIEGLKKDREEIPEETESAQMRILVTA